MNRSFRVMLFAAGVVAFLPGSPVFAQDAAAPAQAAPVAAVVPAAEAAPAVTGMPADEDKFSFGKVVSVAEGQVTVKEYDFVKDAGVETVYATTSETEFGNVAALKDLAAGDDIVIDYLEKDGKKLITTLVKEEKGMEAAPAEGAAAPAEGTAVPAEGAAAPAAAPVK